MTQGAATRDGWEAHRIDQIRRTASATPLQRLRWLEAAIAFAFMAGALPDRATPVPGRHRT